MARRPDRQASLVRILSVVGTRSRLIKPRLRRRRTGSRCAGALGAGRIDTVDALPARLAADEGA
jgi:hypothetical protein